MVIKEFEKAQNLTFSYNLTFILVSPHQSSVITLNILMLWKGGQKLARRLKEAPMASLGMVQLFESVLSGEWAWGVQRMEVGECKSRAGLSMKAAYNSDLMSNQRSSAFVNMLIPLPPPAPWHNISFIHGQPECLILNMALLSCPVLVDRTWTEAKYILSPPSQIYTLGLTGRKQLLQCHMGPIPGVNHVLCLHCFPPRGMQKRLCFVFF